MLSNKVRRIIKNSKQIKRIILGTASLGSRLSYKNSVELVSCAYEIGIQAFDTGPLYGACQAHSILNDAFNQNYKIYVYSKFLSKLVNEKRLFAKLIYRRCGIKAYKNFFLSRKLYKQAIESKINKSDIDLFIEKQKIFYPNIPFKGWFLHSPKINTLTIEDFNDFGYSGDLEFYRTSNYNPFIQTSAKSIYNFDTKKLNTEKIFVNRIYSFAKSKNIPPNEIYKKLLDKDERINIVIGTSKINKLKNIVNNIF